MSDVFISSGQSLKDASRVLFGAPMDWTVSFRPGSRFGPGAIRQASYNLETWSGYAGGDLEDVSFYDIGDLSLPYGNPARSLDIIEKVTGMILRRGKRPCMLGGEHLVTLGAIRAIIAKYPHLRIVHFDAHADLRHMYHGERLSHATVMRLSSELLESPSRLYQFGIRSGLKDEFDWARKNVRFFPFKAVEPLKAVISEIEDGSPVYLSIDIDVVDPAFASGTGTPEAGGITSSDMLECVQILKNCNIVGWDIVEVAPNYDQSGATAALAAKLVREMLISL